MATTLENTLIRFNDGTTQSTAATTPPAASTSVAGIVQLTTSTSSTSTTLAATASAVKAAYDLAANHTHSQYLDTDIGHNEVGSLCFAWNTGSSYINPGSTLAGSALYPAGLRATESNTNSPASLAATAPTLSGTWRCLGYSKPWVATLWQRIS